MASGDGGAARSPACASSLWTVRSGTIVVGSKCETGATPIGTARAAEAEPLFAEALSAIGEASPSATARSDANRARLAVTIISTQPPVG
jgi:hypothetical protein